MRPIVECMCVSITEVHLNIINLKVLLFFNKNFFTFFLRDIESIHYIIPVYDCTYVKFVNSLINNIFYYYDAAAVGDNFC